MHANETPAPLRRISVGMTDNSPHHAAFSHMTIEAVRVDRAKVRAQLEYLGAFRGGSDEPRAVDGIPADLIDTYLQLNAEMIARTAA